MEHSVHLSHSPKWRLQAVLHGVHAGECVHVHDQEATNALSASLQVLPETNVIDTIFLNLPRYNFS